MINVERITMKHPQFRLKIDMSKFFDDARQFCWIFIDETKKQVIHIQKHISQLFSIAEPFHLLLNETEYLPPNEDIRILKENETIQVVPGTGIKNKVNKTETCNGSRHDGQVHRTVMKSGTANAQEQFDAPNMSNSTLNDTPPISINTTENMTFYSVINDTVANETETDSKVTDNNLTEEFNAIDSSVISLSKRKRIRKRRSKKESKTQLISPSLDEEKPKKLKVIESYVIPSGKHIRFDKTELEENNIAKGIVQDVSQNESCISKVSISKNLSTLLGLGQSSTPLTFTNKKVKNDVKMENETSDEIKNKIFTIGENNSMENNLGNKEKTQNLIKWMDSDLHMIPIMSRKPLVKDIIAFKTLKIGDDYTPQLSNFIIAEIVNCCIISEKYDFKLIKGKEEVQVPIGKFSLSEETSADDCVTDGFTLYYSQIQEPRLLSCSKSFVS